MAASLAPLVGRTREREEIAGALEAVRAGEPGIVAIEGEPGIGKSRLLAHVEADATAGECTVLAGRASEFEADLPYALWTDALDRHLAEAGERRLSRLGLADPGALGIALPALAELAERPAQGDRHRTHRAMRDLLERLADTRPLALCLDDVHWGDSESMEALVALIRRPASGRVLLAVAAREGQVPPALAAALSAAVREDRLTRLVLGPLSEPEATELVGNKAAAAVYEQSGGNPFYLEQLVRAGRETAPARGIASDGSLPPAIAAALAGELGGLTHEARRLLDAAAVTGDPFEPGLAAEVAELSERAGLAALDELLASALTRPAGAPRLFAFRHPVVRHAVYEGAPRGWRLGAHARAAQALERRGAGPVERAHHVEQAARPGDEQAIHLLTTAAHSLQSPAPAAAARFHAAALRLLRDRPDQRARRTRVQTLLADALAAAGDRVQARETLIEALRTSPTDQRLRLTVTLANAEWWLGLAEEARRRLHVALGELPAEPSPDRIRLRLGLALTALFAGDFGDVEAQASDARDDARAIGDPVFEAAALAGRALARVSEADGPEVVDALDESTAALERLSGEQLATRLPALWMHGRARHWLGQLDAALADFERGSIIAADTGRESVLLLLTVESVQTLVELGRIEEAGAAGEEGVERARLSGIPRMLLWAQSALASARLAAGDSKTRSATPASRPRSPPHRASTRSDSPDGASGRCSRRPATPSRRSARCATPSGASSSPTCSRSSARSPRPTSWRRSSPAATSPRRRRRSRAARPPRTAAERRRRRGRRGWLARPYSSHAAARESPWRRVSPRARPRLAHRSCPRGPGLPTVERSPPWVSGAPPSKRLSKRRPSSTRSAPGAGATRRCASCDGWATASSDPPRSLRPARSLR